jgi:hypothetical protein
MLLILWLFERDDIFSRHSPPKSHVTHQAATVAARTNRPNPRQTRTHLINRIRVPLLSLLPDSFRYLVIQNDTA